MSHNWAFITLAVVLQLIKTAKGGGPAAYLFYKNAKCNNYNSTITGTMILAYNDERLQGRGRVHKHYYGSCKYFDGGYYDFQYSTASFEILNGYCIECNGVVGCTNIKNDCSGFQSEIPSNVYTLSSYYDNSKSDADNSDYDVYATADLVDYHVYKAIQGSHDNFYQVLGVICGMTLLLAFFAKTVARNMETEIDSSKFLDVEGYNGSEMVNPEVSATRNAVLA